MYRFVAISGAIAVLLFPLAPARACNHCWDTPCQEGNRLGRAGAAILGGFAGNPPIPGTTWGYSPSGRIVPVPVDGYRGRSRRWRSCPL
jgi:hypothetical protein